MLVLVVRSIAPLLCHRKPPCHDKAPAIHGGVVLYTASTDGLALGCQSLGFARRRHPVLGVFTFMTDTEFTGFPNSSYLLVLCRFCH